MKIDNSIKGITTTRSKEVRNDRAPAATSPAPGATANDKVVFTHVSAQLGAMEEVLANLAITDAAKIESVRGAIADGRFQVSEEVVAEALVETTMEQLRRQGGQ